MKVYVVVNTVSCKVRVFPTEEMAKGVTDAANFPLLMDGANWFPTFYKEAEIEEVLDETEIKKILDIPFPL